MVKWRKRRRSVRLDSPGGEERPIRFELFGTERLEQLIVSLAESAASSRRWLEEDLVDNYHHAATFDHVPPSPGPKRRSNCIIRASGRTRLGLLPLLTKCCACSIGTFS
jgi:hypothetical protein